MDNHKIMTEEQIRNLLLSDVESKRFDSTDYIQSSVSILEGSGSKKEKPLPFNYERALSKFYSWCYIASNINATKAASVPLKLYVKIPKSTKKSLLWNTKKLSISQKNYLSTQIRNKDISDYEVVNDNHPITDLLYKINPYQNSYDLFYMMFIYLELVGNAYIHPIINESLGIPEQLYIMPSQWVNIKPATKNSTNFIEGYIYGKEFQDRRDFTTDEIIHIKYPNPKDIYYGFGKVEAVWDMLCINEEQKIMAYNWYKNSARPDFALIIKNASEGNDSIAKFENKVNKLLKGNKNTGKFLTVTGDVDIKPLQFDTVEILQNQELIIREIAGTFGIPEPKLTMNSANYSNAEIAEKSWLESTITPMLRLVESKLNDFLLPLYGQEVYDNAFLAFDNVVPEDKEFNLKKDSEFVKSGIITVNELRQKEGMDSIEGGDVLKTNSPAFDLASLTKNIEEIVTKNIQQFMTKEVSASPTLDLSTLETKIENIILKNIQQKETTPFNININTQNEEEVDTKELEVVEEKPTKMGLFMAKYADDINVKNAEDNYITKIENVFTDIFEKQKEDIIKYAEKNTKSFEVKSLNKDVKEIIEKYNEEIQKEITPLITKVIEIGGIEAVKDLGLSSDVFDVYNEEVSKQITEKTIKLAGSVSDTTVENIRTILKDGFEKGEAVNELTKRIKEATAFTKDRSEKIARTEAAQSFVSGEIEGWKQSGQVSRVKWLLSPNACSHCKAIADKVNSVELGKPFIKQGDSFNGITYDYSDVYPGNLHPCCRCDVTAILSD